MVDFLTPGERSIRMSRIKGKDTVPEINLRKALHALGLRFRLQCNKMPGKPDLVFPKYKVVVFVHGCFWHRHEGCKVSHIPKSNTPFWIDKFKKNVARDERVKQSLLDLGWRVFVVWECEVDSAAKAEKTASLLEPRIRGRVV